MYNLDYTRLPPDHYLITPGGGLPPDYHPITTELPLDYPTGGALAARRRAAEVEDGEATTGF